MKKISLYLLLPILLILLTGCENNNDANNNTNNQIGSSATTTEINHNTTSPNSTPERITVQIEDQNMTNINQITNNIIENLNTNTEKELSSFSTEILTSDPNRNNNIHLTCKTLDGHIVKSGETFSFTELIGKSTTNKGYKEANIIEADGDTTKGLGGGNCQVSSTLYNAVSQIPDLEVLERHNHSAEVYYVPLGQDAAVAYGSVDFKFKNNSKNDIKIYASTDDKKVMVRIVEI